jgi:hypothetical protein
VSGFPDGGDVYDAYRDPHTTDLRRCPAMHAVFEREQERPRGEQETVGTGSTMRRDSTS